MPITPSPASILALDVGEVRIGEAIASLVARLPRPLVTLDAQDNVMDHLRQIIANEAVGALVVGLPRNLHGEDTAQTEYVRNFGHELEQLGLPVSFQDEALTSQKAESELKARGKMYTKGDIDALAATFILEDFLITHPGAA